MMNDYQINRIKDLLVEAMEDKDIFTITCCENALKGNLESLAICLEISRQRECNAWIKSFPGFDD